MGDAHVLQALAITTLAGLSTAIGSVIGFFSKRPSPLFLAFTMGFSAGVMIFVAFAELLPTALKVPELGFAGAHIAFFTGMTAYFLIDLVIPHDYIGQHDHAGHRPAPGEPASARAMERTGLLVTVGITIHNFPEGMGTFVGAMQDLHLGMALGVAIALHNIPEGLAISAPVYFATGSRKKAFLWSLFSGGAEIAGGLLAAAVLLPFMSPALMGCALAAVGGIMVAISLDELIPVAKSLDSEHAPITGVIAGMLVMALSLQLLK